MVWGYNECRGAWSIAAKTRFSIIGQQLSGCCLWEELGGRSNGPMLVVRTAWRVN